MIEEFAVQLAACMHALADACPCLKFILECPWIHELIELKIVYTLEHRF